MRANLPTTLGQQIVERHRHLIEGVGGRTDRGDLPVADQGQQIVQERLLIGTVLHGPDPQSMPSTVRLRSSTWLSAIFGMAPEAKPMTR